MKYGIGNYFSLPNEIFLLGLSSGNLQKAVYTAGCNRNRQRRRH